MSIAEQNNITELTGQNLNALVANAKEASSGLRVRSPTQPALTV